MKKTLLIVMIVFAALVIGIGGAYAVSGMLPDPTAGLTDNKLAGTPGEDEYSLPDQIDGFGGRMGRRGMPDGWQDRMPGNIVPFQGMNPYQGTLPNGDDVEVIGERISIDEAVAQAQAYTAELGDNLQVTEVMEFSRNFYAVVIEKDSGKGALELLIDPYSGSVGYEPGPNMMWNTKYGHMRSQDQDSANTLSMTDAASAAQQALDEQVPGAVLKTDGVEFYGYYSFDYSLDGEIVGMLSVNGSDGRVWLHNWHGEFIGEKEIE